MTVVQPASVEGIIVSPCRSAAIVSPTADTAADQSVAVGPSSLARKSLMIRR